MTRFDYIMKHFEMSSMKTQCKHIVKKCWYHYQIRLLFIVNITIAIRPTLYQRTKYSLKYYFKKH